MQYVSTTDLPFRQNKSNYRAQKGVCIKFKVRSKRTFIRYFIFICKLMATLDIFLNIFNTILALLLIVNLSRSDASDKIEPGDKLKVPNYKSERKIERAHLLSRVNFESNNTGMYYIKSYLLYMHLAVHEELPRELQIVEINARVVIRGEHKLVVINFSLNMRKLFCKIA